MDMIGHTVYFYRLTVLVFYYSAQISIEFTFPSFTKVLDDETESFTSFRRQFDRIMEDLEGVDNPKDATKLVTKFKRDVLEDELEKVRIACERVARMNSISRIGTYVGLASLSIAGLYGLSPAAAITGATAASVALLNALYKSYEDKRDARRSPMYFVWRLAKHTD
jgi:hypothetical protein